MRQTLKQLSNSAVFWWLTVAYVMVWFLPRVTEKGLFSDGLVYTTVAHNLSSGIGSFWAPVIRNGDFLFGVHHAHDVFYAHPPLLFGIEALFYRVFGDQTEMVYNSVVLILLLAVMLGIFKLMHNGRPVVPLAGYIPIFFLFTSPEFLNKAGSNLLDTTLALFCAAAVWAILTGLTRPGRWLPWAVAGGIGIVGAVLVKGPVGLFPLAVPAAWAWVYRPKASIGRAAWMTGILMAIMAVAALFTYAYEPARTFFKEYLSRQVLSSMLGEGEKVRTWYNHLSIFRKILEQSGIMFGIALIGAAVIRRRQQEPLPSPVRASLLFLAIAFAASLPIALSPKHHSFYLIPSLVFFALSAASHLVAVLPDSWGPRPARFGRVSVGFSIAVIAGVTIYSFALPQRYYGTHKPFLSAMDSLMVDVPHGTVIETTPEILNKRHDVNGYLERYFDARLTVVRPDPHYFLSFSSDSLPAGNVVRQVEANGFRMAWYAPSPASPTAQ